MPASEQSDTSTAASPVQLMQAAVVLGDAFLSTVRADTRTLQRVWVLLGGWRFSGWQFVHSMSSRLQPRRHLLAVNPHLSPEWLLAHLSVEDLAAVWIHPAVPPDRFLDVARAIVERHARTTGQHDYAERFEPVLQRLSGRRPDPSRRWALTPDILTAPTAEAASAIVARVHAPSTSTEDVVAALCSRHCPPELIRWAADHEEPRVRGAAAYLCNEVDVLLHLARDEVEDVVADLARRPGVPGPVLDLLVSDGRVDVALGTNPTLTPTVFDGLAAGSRSDVHLAVAANPSAPVEVLQRIAREGDGLVRRELIERPDADDGFRSMVESAGAVASHGELERWRTQDDGLILAHEAYLP